MASTVKWLNESLEPVAESTPPLHRLGRVWQPIAGFSRVGSIFSIYKDATEYCVHTGEIWDEGQTPMLGYYNGDLSLSDLIPQIAQKYDSIRNRH